MRQQKFFQRGETNPYCPAAIQIALDQPLLSALRLSGWLGISPSTLVRWADRAGLGAAMHSREVVRGINPCGFNICAAAIRMLWSPDISKRQVGKWLGIAGTSATRWADTVGLDSRVNVRPPKQISARAVRTAWMDQTITTAEAAKRVGLSTRSLYERSLKMQLPPRKSGVAAKPWPDDFNEMWAAGLTTRDMAKLCSRRAASHITVEAQRRGLPGRRIGMNNSPPTIEEYHAMKLREAMAATAKIEQGHWRNAEMVDSAARTGRWAA